MSHAASGIPAFLLDRPSSKAPVLLEHNLVPLDANTLSTLWVLVNLLLEPGLDRPQHLLIPLGADERNGDSLGSKSPSTTDTVQVGVSSLSQGLLVAGAWVGRRVWHVVIDGDVDALNVDAATENVGADADAMDKVLEVGVALDTVRGLVRVIEH
jgi:hypothetical protein